MSELLNAKTIVCIDDEPDILLLLQLILSRAGFNPIGATDALSGINAIRDVKPDLVLLDLMLPGTSGWGVYWQMKDDDALRQIPVIVVTVRAGAVDKALALHFAEVDDYVTKPFAIQDLLSSVRRALALPT